MAKVLVVEDDPAIAAELVRGLTRAGYEVELATSGPMGLAAATASEPDLVVLDLMLPEMHGHEVLRKLRVRTQVPVIVLTAGGQLDARLLSFDLGADDFVAKPFWMEELVARVRTRLNQRATTQARTIAFGAVVLDLDARTASVSGEPVQLTPTEFSLVVFLAERRGRAVARGQLVDALGNDASARTIDSHVTRARKKLGPDGDAIKTVWGVGYRFDAVPSSDGAGGSK